MSCPKDSGNGPLYDPTPVGRIHSSPSRNPHNGKLNSLSGKASTYDQLH